ncbi:hypothetical protein EDC96DRAFT_510941 [Choanephora cucurbitarum]|nr:hypothetical protein EDC96DRAFT_510941 [Choanephora cucurbitarum]
MFCRNKTIACLFLFFLVSSNNTDIERSLTKKNVHVNLSKSECLVLLLWWIQERIITLAFNSSFLGNCHYD